MTQRAVFTEYEGDITIQVNGEYLPISKNITTVADLIERLHLTHRRFFIIEKNRTIIPPENYAVEPVRADDCFEIVHFVGGG